MILALLVACARVPAPPDGPVNPTLTTPMIKDLTLGCDVDKAEWTLDVVATSWTGGGDWYWTMDGTYVEHDTVGTKTAKPDGSKETLEAILGIVADWRQAGDGATAFHCTDAPAWRFVLNGLDGNPTDCRFDGDPNLWSAQPDVPACDTPWTTDTPG